MGCSMALFSLQPLMASCFVGTHFLTAFSFGNAKTTFQNIFLLPGIHNRAPVPEN
jgi:hypothetical protein